MNDIPIVDLRNESDKYKFLEVSVKQLPAEKFRTAVLPRARKIKTGKPLLPVTKSVMLALAVISISARNLMAGEKSRVEPYPGLDTNILKAEMEKVAEETCGKIT